MAKLLVIGMDGATLDLIGPWAEKGLLPNMAKLMQSGVYGRLRSVLPVLTSAAWPSFMTGVNPGKHGLFDFVRRAADSYQLRPVNRSQMQSETLWSILSRAGRRVGVVNVPMTFPPEKVNGVMVTGLYTPDFKPFTYPTELSEELNSRGYAVNRKTQFELGKEDDYLREVHAIVANLTENASWLMNRQDWDFFMLVFFDTDQMAHFFWHHMDDSHPQHQANTKYQDAILEYYQAVDRAIGQIVNEAGSETNIMLVSDHGTGALYKNVYLNEWLRQKGWLVLLEQKDSGGKLRDILGRVGLTRSNISAGLRKLGLRQVENWIKEALGDRIEMLPKSAHTKFPDVIDWSKTRAYSFGYNGQIYINLRGREPEGIVAPGEEYDRVCRQIEQELMELVDPEDRKPVVEKVYLGKTAFWGEAAAAAPDLFLVMRGLAYITQSGYEFGDQPGQVVAAATQAQTGSHRMEGVWMLAGPDVEPAGRVGEVVITDLAPTILHLLNCAVPENMDGKVLEEWLKTTTKVQRVESEANPAAETAVTMSEEDEERMIQRLKELGYLE